MSEDKARPRRQKVRKGLLLSSFLLLPVTMFYFSPYLVIDGGSHGLIVASFLVFSALFLVSLVVGRLWCGWLCPMGGCQEYSASLIRDKRARGGRYNWIKFFIWVPWLAGIILAFIKAGGIKSVQPFYHFDYGVTVATWQNIFFVLAIVVLLVVLVVTTGRRGFCHYVCWISPFMIVGRKISNTARFPGLRLLANSDLCIDCKKCTQICPMSLDVNALVKRGSMEDSECNLCGECADSCPKDVLSYRFCRPVRAEKRLLTSSEEE
jgi:ferredoxin-type protein NapH